MSTAGKMNIRSGRAQVYLRDEHGRRLSMTRLQREFGDAAARFFQLRAAGKQAEAAPVDKRSSEWRAEREARLLAAGWVRLERGAS